MRPIPICLLSLCSALALPAQKPIAVDASVKTADLTNRDARPPVAPVSEQIQLKADAPAGVTLPTGEHGVLAGVQTIAGKRIVVAAAKSSADAEHPDSLFVDLDGDGKFADTEKLAIDVQTQQPGQQQGGQQRPPMHRAAPVDAEFTFGTATIPARIGYSQMGDAAPTATVMFPSYLEAKSKVGDAECTVAVLDKNLDGTFDDAEDLWAVIPPAKEGERAPGPMQPMALSLLGERRFLNGQLVGIKVTSPATVEVTAVPAKGPDAKDAAAHRVRVEHVWSERFDKEREQFVAARKLDTSRPKADKPIDWRYVTFDEAVAMAKKEQKPLFVDVMAFWCVWCYRMDYYTYCDQEVAELLNGSFVPVKIVQEQDVAGDYERVRTLLGARGIPAMGVFDTDGNVVHKIGGWMPPSGEKSFVDELKTGLDAAKK